MISFDILVALLRASNEEGDLLQADEWKKAHSEVTAEEVNASSIVLHANKYQSSGARARANSHNAECENMKYDG